MESGRPVETAGAPGNSAGHGNSQHASNSAAANASAANEPTEPGVASGHGHSSPSYSASASVMGDGRAASGERGQVARPPRIRQLRTHQRPTSRQNRASHPATATRPQHTRRQQALRGRPSRSKLPAHPVIARATVTRSTPRIRQLRTHQRPTSRQSRASHPATATRPHHTRRQQVPWRRPCRSKLPTHPVIARATGNSQHASNSAARERVGGQPSRRAVVTPAQRGHGNSQHASNRHRRANELTEPASHRHGNSPPSHSASASAMGAAEPVETGAHPVIARPW